MGWGVSGTDIPWGWGGTLEKDKDQNGQREEKEHTSGEGNGAFISEKRKSLPHLGGGTQ